MSLHIETSQLIFRTNQLTDFYMMEKLAVKRLTDMSSSFLRSIAYGPFDVTTVTLLLNVSV